MLRDEIRVALRLLAKMPGFTITAIITLAVGIGATTALFSLVDAVLISPLPFKQPDRLVALYSRTKLFNKSATSYLNFLDWQSENHTFKSMAAFVPDDVELTGVGEPRLLHGEMVSSDFFSLLGVEPALGRDFTPNEDQVGGAPVALISARLWRETFASSPAVLGKSVALNDGIYTIIGVIPDTFHYESGNFTQNSDVFLPIGQRNDSVFRDRRGAVGMDVVGRLKTGMTLAQAEGDMELIAQHLGVEYPEADKDVGTRLIPLKQDVVGDVGWYLLLLMAAVAGVLLIASTNVAMLLLARSRSRIGEFALRAALGANRLRLIRQLFIESLLLCAMGGALGVLLSKFGLAAALQFLPKALPRSNEIHLNASVLLFTLILCAVVAIFFTLGPATRMLRTTNVREALTQGLRGATKRQNRTQRLFVVVEVALTVILMTGAGLMIRSVAKLWVVDPGFNSHNVLIFGLSSATDLGSTPAEIHNAHREIASKLESTPGIEAASLKTGALPIHGGPVSPFWLQGEPKPTSHAKTKEAVLYVVQPDYLKVMKIPMVQGRFLTDADNESSRPVAVIDESLARLYFGGKNPIGQQLNVGSFGTAPQIVGVIGHVKQWGLASDKEKAIQAQIYLPLSQLPSKFVPLMARGAAVAVRTKISPLSEIDPIRRTIQDFNPEAVVYEFDTMDGFIAHSLAPRRFVMMILTIFSALALLLACVGIYGVISYLVGQRSHEMSIRMALGAQQKDVMRMVLGEGVRTAVIGMAIGIGGAALFARFMSRFLFGVSTKDPMTFAVVLGVVASLVILASYQPAWRAAHVDPQSALRAL